jgi:hypothetical protein
MRFGVNVLIGLGVALWSGAVMAQTMPAPRTMPQPGQWSLTPMIGSDVTVGGEFSKAASQSASVSGSGFTGTATVSLISRRFDDMYDTPILAALSTGYGVSNAGEVFGTVRYEHASGKTTAIGSATVAGTLNGQAVSASAPISAKADEFNQVGLDIGYRHFFPTGSNFLPYVSGSVGFNYVPAIDVALSSGGTDLGKSHFYKDSVTAGVGLNLGLSYAIASGAALGIEAGVRYDSKLDGHSDASGVTSGDRVSVPLVATGRFTF